MASRWNLPAVLAAMFFVLSFRGTFAQFDLGAAVENVEKVTDPPAPDLGNPFIESIDIRSIVSTGVASTETAVRILNNADTDESTTFNFLMPLDALISNYTVVVSGEDKDYSYDDASRIFDSEVSERGSDVRVFAVDVTVPAESEVELKLTYQELLRRMDGQYRQNIYLKPGQLAENINVDVSLEDQVPLTSVGSSWESSDDASSFDVEPDVTRDDSSRASVNFVASSSDQEAESPAGMNGYLTVSYDADQGDSAGTLSVSNGYFIHRISPQGLSPVNKNTLFVVDTSGSMAGTKLESAQTAIRNFIGGMKGRDNFNVVSFSDVPQFWKSQSRRATTNNKMSALTFVEEMEPGTTDDNGLYMAMESVVPALDANPSEFQNIVLITDGSSIDPAGKDGDRITRLIDDRYALNIIDLSDVDSDQSSYFLRNLATVNNGAYRRVVPSSDANVEISRFLDDYSRTLMYNVETSYLNDAVDPDSLTKHMFLTYYDGQDLVVSGRLREGSTIDTLTSRVTGNVAGGSFELETSAPVESTFVREFENFSERGWKFMTLTDEIEISNLARTSSSRGPSVLEMAETFEFVLDDSKLPPLTIAGRGDTAAGDPHIVIQDPSSDLRICFDIHGPQGTVVSLVEDPVLEIAVNGEMVAKGNVTNWNLKKSPPTFFGRIAVLLGDDWITISRENVMINWDLQLKWFRNTVQQVGPCKLSIVRRKLVKISCPNGVVMKISRHRVFHGDYDHFDFFLGKGQMFSPSVDGIIGQFQRQQMSLVKSSIRKTKYGKEKGVLVLGEKEIKVTQVTRRRLGACWASYAKKGLLMLESNYEDYILPQLFSKRY